MNPALADALGKIERGAERHLQARRAEFEQMQQKLGMGQWIVSHIEKKEEPDEGVTENIPAAKDTDDTTTEEENPPAGPRKCATQSISALKKAAAEAKIKEQKLEMGRDRQVEACHRGRPGRCRSRGSDGTYGKSG